MIYWIPISLLPQISRSLQMYRIKVVLVSFSIQNGMYLLYKEYTSIDTVMNVIKEPSFLVTEWNYVLLVHLPPSACSSEEIRKVCEGVYMLLSFWLCFRNTLALNWKKKIELKRRMSFNVNVLFVSLACFLLFSSQVYKVTKSFLCEDLLR